MPALATTAIRAPASACVRDVRPPKALPFRPRREAGWSVERTETRAGPGQAVNLDSVVYEWNGESFAEFQRIPSRWAYNWHAFEAGGEFFVVVNKCSHAEEKLDCGRVRAGWVACPVHGARFRLATGEAMNPPATQPIATFAVRVVDGWIEADV